MDKSCDQSVASSAQTDDATMKLRQGSILPRTVRDQLRMSALKDNPDPVVIVISHDCDLVKPHGVEPHVELIGGQSKDELKSGLSNGQSPRTLHLEYEQSGTKKVIELCALDKTLVDKRMLIHVHPDPDAVLAPKGIEILQSWLAARYSRAAFPDDLDRRMKPLKEKLRSVNPKAIIGIWMRFEPQNNHLPDEIPYELWVKIVYKTLEFDGEAKAEQEVKKLRLSFEKNFRDEGVWRSIDLRACEAVADTVFSVRDLLDYKQWRLEHLSLRQDPPGEYL